jgi:hypothetical protein
MKTPKRWSRAVVAIARYVPFLGQLPSSARAGLLIVAFWAGGGLALVGGLMGWLNRGMVGAPVGMVLGAFCGVVGGGVVGTLWGARSLPQEGTVTLALQLDQHAPRYVPGETLSGQLQVSAGDTLKMSGGAVYLVCRGHYAYDLEQSDGEGNPEFVRETRQYLVRKAEVMREGTIRRDATHNYAFQFTIPEDALPTHQGYICVVRWTLHALVELPDLEPAVATQELFVEAIAPALRTAGETHQSVLPAQNCQVILSLPRVIHAEGERLAGKVQITPLETFYVREVRAVLLRLENTPSGSDHTVFVGPWDAASGSYHAERHPGGQGTTYVWLEDETILSGPAQFKIVETINLPFSLDIPPQWRPTLATKDGRVTWKVGVVVSRTNYPDLRVFHEVIVHTGISQVPDVLDPSRSAGGVA